MTFHRYVYKVLWKSRLLWALVLICCVLALVATLYNHETSIHKHSILPRYSKSQTLADKIKPSSGPSKDTRNLDHNEKQPTLANENSKPEHPRHKLPSTDEDIIRHYVETAKKKAAEIIKERANHNDKEITDRVILQSNTSTFPSKTRKRKFANTFRPYHAKKILYDIKNPPEHFRYYSQSQETRCEGKFKGFFNEFALLNNVTFDQQYCSGRKGGEEITDVLNQAEESEFYTYEMGCIQMSCQDRPSYYFNNKNHLNDLFFALQTKDIKENAKQVIADFYILITRYEYANMYHTMTDWYNAFLIMNFFNKTQEETNILLVDGHPKGALDPVWPVLFNSSIRLAELQQTIQFSQLAFNILGYNSPFLDHTADHIPLIEEYREFFLRSFRLPFSLTTPLNCDTLNVLFIWRRDYLAHPRNPKGKISRKIANERQLLEHIQRLYPAFHVRGVQIDLFDMRQQLSYISTADILVGMHGAGLTHATFLPKHAGVIELLPNYWGSAMDHFMAIAKWRGLPYERWTNVDQENEVVPDELTRVPVLVLESLFRSILRQMGCNKKGVTERVKV